MKSITVRLDVDLDPFELGSRSGLLWSRAHSGDPVPLLAGIGEALRIPLSRPGGATEAQARLAGLAGPNDLTGPGTGPVAFGALPFDRSSPGELLVPEIVIGRGVDGRRWLTIVGDGSVGVDDALERSRATLDGGTAGGAQAGLPTPQPTSYDLRSQVGPEVWRDGIVATARDRIRAGGLQKVVLARELVLRTDAPIDRTAVLDRLQATFPSAILFAVDGFLGASPELLVGRHGDVVRAHPLAGTAPRSSDPAADQVLAAGLLSSTKDRWEHQITIDWLLDGLLPFCSYVDAEPEPSLVSLANVHHLGTLVEGRLSSPSASVLELVAALHPTPAVGGDPQVEALGLIAEIERTDRGRYAGPVGWVDAEGNGSFAVGIRSAEIDGLEARLFAGVGVVADSEPEAELAETRAKFRAMLGAMVQP
ncbi:MAG: isochorismate synthase [Acidimicrobiia bacterium]|nr:isochorismate synthase [Acidimicrobiia bacterium]